MFQVLIQYKAGFLKIKINKQNIDLQISKPTILLFMLLLFKKESNCIKLIYFFMFTPWHILWDIYPLCNTNYFSGAAVAAASKGNLALEYVVK